MIVTFAVYYEDGTSGVVNFEKPPGYHPDSAAVGFLAAQVAVTGTNSGKVCVKTSRTKVHIINLTDGGKDLHISDTSWEGRYPS